MNNSVTVMKPDSSDPTSCSSRASLGNGPVPLEPYRSQEFFELERKNIFGRAWLLVGRADDLPKSGDYVVKQIEIAETSVLIARDRNARLGAFYNVCPHRGNQLVVKASGSTPVFVCPYHNWSFSNDGALRGVPDQEMFLDLDKQKCGLKTICLDIWDGWIFINLSPTPEISLTEFLSGFRDFFTGVENINKDDAIVIETYLKSNWKVVSDAFLEAYHIPAIHSATLKAAFSNNANMYGRLLDARSFGPHAFNSMFGNPEYQPSEKQLVEKAAYDPRHMEHEHIEAIMRFRGHSAVNPTRSNNWQMDTNFIFPNTHIDVGAGGFWTHQFWPISVNETRHEARFYTRKAKTVRQRFMQEMSAAAAVDIVLEDLANVERTQRGINSRGTDYMQLSESEVSLRHSVHHVMKWASAPTVAEAMGS